MEWLTRDEDGNTGLVVTVKHFRDRFMHLAIIGKDSVATRCRGGWEVRPAIDWRIGRASDEMCPACFSTKEVK